ncbi:MAG: hypothetical protein V3T58_02150 [Candidatus Hydrothermarchaeales archaeon]
MDKTNNDFKVYLYGRWFIRSVETSWKLTRNPTIARISAEKAGQKIFKDKVRKPEEWTIEGWIEAVKQGVHSELGTDVEFEASADSVIMKVNTCPFEDIMKVDRYATCSFHYGTWKSLFTGAFPEGELLLPEVISKGAPKCLFKFLVKASDDERMLAMRDRRDIFSK